MTDPAAIAASLTDAQRILITGDYDPEFARIDDAATLERLGLWSFDASKQDPDSEYYEMDVTPLGISVRNIIQEQSK